MIQYLDLLREIKDKGTWKEAAREGMPRTLSLFGAQMRFDLQEGFPLLTTKKIKFEHIVTELLWFLKGDTNIKYLVDNGCNIWNEDAYNYYLKLWNTDKFSKSSTGKHFNKLTYEEFIEIIKNNPLDDLTFGNSIRYKLGDCGKQYGWLWRSWENKKIPPLGFTLPPTYKNYPIDQIKELIDGLKKNPMGRRHIITAWNPATLNDMALNACHALVQFNCRTLSLEDRTHYWFHNSKPNRDVVDYFDAHFGGDSAMKELDKSNVPRYYLDCQMYQRSADVFLGVPYNIASYALLTEILCKICNMVPGDFIHTFGDVHIYENHMEQVDEQLSRTPTALPKLNIKLHMKDFNVEQFNYWLLDDFELKDYNPQPSIKAKLSTGLK